VILAITVAAALGAYLWTRAAVRARQALLFSQAVETTYRTMDLYFTHYLNVLTGTKALFDASELVRPEQFERYLESIDLRADHPGLLDVGYAMRVRAGETGQHLAAMARLGFTDYEPNWGGDGEEHFPVVFLETFTRSGVRSSGWDASAEPQRRAAMEKACALGQPVASGKAELFTPDGRDQPHGFLLYLPIYAGQATPVTVPERRQALQGFDFGSFVTAELWADIFAKGGEPLIDFEVYDGPDPSPQSLLYDQDKTRRGSDPLARSRFTARKYMSGLERTWAFHFASLPALEQSPEASLPLFVLLAGASIAATLFGLALTQARGRANAEALAHDLRRSQEALLRSEERFRGIFESIQDIYFRTDMEARLTLVSPACSALTGYRPEEVAGEPVADRFVSPEDRERVLSTLLEHGEVRDVEVRLRKKDGQVAIMSVNARLVRDAQGQPLAVEGTLRDITARKQVEEALRESQTRLQAVVSHSPIVLYAVDARGVLTLAEGQALAALGLRPGERVGQSLFDMYRDHPQVLGFLRRGLAEEEFTATIELGRAVLEAWCAPVRDADGQVIGLIGAGVDITQRRRAETALAAEKERLMVTLGSIGDGVITTDTTGRVVPLNEAAGRLTGWPEVEAVGHPLANICYLVDPKSGQRLADPIRAVLETSARVELPRSTALVARDAARRVVSGSAAPIQDRQGRLLGVVLALRDVTERERLEAEQLKSGKLESLGLLAGGIAHDFNNILAGIMGNLSLLLLMSEEESETKQRLAEAEKACQRARHLTQQLLTFAKGGAPVKATAVLTDVIKDSAQFVLSGSDCQCEFVLASDLWTVEADKGQISQVIQNLVLNAEHAMPEGGIIRVVAENLTLAPDSGAGRAAGPLCPHFGTRPRHRHPA
jgi:PAS domain S-box-containing protein